MQKVQIYIGSTRLDLFKDETITLTQSIKDVKDISKIFTDFTQTFSVPASPTNNILFQHYYNFNIEPGFDARQKKQGSIELNYIPFKTGLIRLDGVDLKNNKPYAYRITFFGETINLKDILSDFQLDSLASLNLYNTEYTSTAVLAAMSVDPTVANLIVPLITHSTPVFYDSGSVVPQTNNMYYAPSSQAGVLFSDLKYAIRVATIISAIETDYLVPAGLSFSTDFFDSANADYFGLFLWLHRKSGGVGVGTEGAPQLTLSISTWVRTSGSSLSLSNSTSLCIYSQFQSPPNNVIQQFDVRIIPTDVTKEYTFIMNGGNGYSYSSGPVKGQLDVDINELGFLGPSCYTFSLNSADQVAFSTVRLTISGQQNINSGLPSNWTDVYNASPDSLGNNIEIPLDLPFVISEQIPEMKIIDFLTGIFKMFNLVAYYEDSKIVVKTYDQYFDFLNTGLWQLQLEDWQDETEDWNDIGSATSNNYAVDPFLSTSSTTVNVGLPYKQINLSYEGTGTFLANKYNQLNNIGWGETRFSLNDQIYDAPSDVYNIKLPFEHMLMERINDITTNAQTNVMYGYSVNENQQPYIGKPLLFYAVLKSQAFGTATGISVRSNSTVNAEKTSIILPSNSVSLDSSVSTENINFQNEINEFSLDSTFTNTLFESYYKTLISESFNSRRRIVRVRTYLPLRILYNIKLNNIIEISSQKYKINTMTSNFQTGETKFELVNTL